MQIFLHILIFNICIQCTCNCTKLNIKEIATVFFWSPLQCGGGRVERRCWVNFQCLGVLLVWMIVGQGPIAFAVGAGGGCLDIFLSHLSFLSPSLWETARYRLKYCLKRPLSPKQPTNRSVSTFLFFVGWSGGAMVLGKLPLPGRPTIWITVGQGPAALVVGAGGVVGL